MTEIFISHSKADDRPLPGQAKGWVSELADQLQTTVRMKDGGSQVNVWLDQRLDSQKAPDTAFAARIMASACFVAVLSPRYLESQGCCRELGNFVARAGEGAELNPLYLVEFLPTERSTWPQAVRWMSPLKFWSHPFDQPGPLPLGWPSPDPRGDRPYWSALNALAHLLSQQVKRLAAAPEGAAAGLRCTPSSTPRGPG